MYDSVQLHAEMHEFLHPSLHKNDTCDPKMQNVAKSLNLLCVRLRSPVSAFCSLAAVRCLNGRSQAVERGTGDLRQQREAEVGPIPTGDPIPTSSPSRPAASSRLATRSVSTGVMPQWAGPMATHATASKAATRTVDSDRHVNANQLKLLR